MSELLFGTLLGALVVLGLKCPEGVKTARRKDKTWGKCGGQQPTPDWTRYKGGATQEDKYKRLAGALGIDTKTHPPKKFDNSSC